MSVIIYADEATWRTVADEYPAIGGVQIRGDLVREEIDGILVPVDPPQLTAEPVIMPVISNDGRRMQSCNFGNDDLAAFQEYWSAFIADGRIQILDAPPSDWKPEGWQEAEPIEDEFMLP
jgi:hypothetical protein